MQEGKNIITIFWKDLHCEICKEKFPINFVHNGEELSLIPLDNKITGSYIMMESFSKEQNSTGIHIIDLSLNQHFRIGRGHNCDLKITDISVSRVHSMLVVSKGKIFLRDNASKFGTLVLRRDPIILNLRNTKTQWLQCGRTCVRFIFKKPWIAYLPCVGSLLANQQIDNERTMKVNPQSYKYKNDDTMIKFVNEDDNIAQDDLIIYNKENAILNQEDEVLN